MPSPAAGDSGGGLGAFFLGPGGGPKGWGGGPPPLRGPDCVAGNAYACNGYAPRPAHTDGFDGREDRHLDETHKKVSANEVDWEPVDTELAVWRAQGLTLRLLVRDDDCHWRPTPALDVWLQMR